MNYNQWKKEELRKYGPNADISKEAFSAFIAEEKLLRARYREANIFWGTQEPKKPKPSKQPQQAYERHCRDGATKNCNKCQKSKPMSEFQFYPNRQFVSSTCKSCGSQLAEE